jgi:hypothetical protein
LRQTRRIRDRGESVKPLCSARLGHWHAIARLTNWSSSSSCRHHCPRSTPRAPTTRPG